MLIEVFSVFAIVCVAIVLGKILTKLKLPAILGWLIVGIVFGPFCVGIVNAETANAVWYMRAVHVFECAAGLMIGSEIVFKKLKTYGKQIFGITVIQSLATFAVVTLCFALALFIAGLPIYLAFIFGGIALATAPAPALSIVNQYHTKGPVTRTLIPLAAIDDIIGIVVFFTVIAVVSATFSGGSVSILSVIASVLMPFAIGIAVGVPAGFLLKKRRRTAFTLLLLLVFIGLAAGAGLALNHFVFKSITLNYILIGVALSATFANIVGSERVEQIMHSFNPLLNISLVVVIVNLGMPLDYRAIAGAGVFTIVYIASRALGKIGGAAVGGIATKAEPTVKRYLGFTLLPHSGVSLIFAGIAITTLSAADPASATLIQGTIAAAAIINEVIAVILAKQAFKWAGEISPPRPVQTLAPVILAQTAAPIPQQNDCNDANKMEQ